MRHLVHVLVFNLDVIDLCAIRKVFDPFNMQFAIS